MKKAARNKKETENYNPKPPIVAVIEPKMEAKKRRKIFSTPIIIGTVVILLIIIAAGAIYGFAYFAPDASTPNDPTGETASLVRELNKIIVVPEETPTIATVTEVEKLSGQPFFVKAQNGDKVIVFGQSKLAVLYRPSLKKVINMSYVNGSETASQGETATPSAQTDISATPTPNAKVKVAVLNSTKEGGLAKKGGNLLDEKMFEVATTSNSNGEYDKTTIVVINKNAVNSTHTQSIQKAFTNVTATTASLPDGEAAPAGSDVVVILGSDFSEAY